jgi:2-polyprenyl-3-methyl-5-hydroxy-6-metoxy-1,4-benzoquinol methylase
MDPTRDVHRANGQANPQAAPPEETRAYTVFDSAWLEERERLALQEAWLDPWSTQQLEALGVGKGWSCLEVGAGGGSIAEWLCARVGAEGLVLATDIDTRFVDTLRQPGLEVLQHDISVDDLPPGRFDLVHARLLLSHLGSRDVVMTKLIRALKPGGWLLVEDYAHLTLGFVDPAEDPERSGLWQAALTVALEFMRARGIDLELGGRLYQICRSHGLLAVHAEGRVSIESGGSVFTTGLSYSIRRLSAIGALASLGEDQLDRTFALLADPEFRMMTQVFMSVRGRKPE